MNRNNDKQLAAVAAIGEVRDGMLVGLGTGSTAAFAIAALGRRIAEEGLRIEAVVTSDASDALARAAGIAPLPFDTIAAIDFAVDGADEVDSLLRAIKGAGGAMLREKIVAAAAARMVVIADGSKRVDVLGAAPLPVEVLPLARAFVAARIERLGGEPLLRGSAEAPYFTDQRNIVLDCRFGAIPDPQALGAALSAIPGVIGHGLFLDEVDALYVASEGIVTCMERPSVP